jgi:AcrR family transcriptional regulator
MQEGTKTPSRGRGRPPQFDPAAALGAATGVFWSRGFAATSLADLAGAMGMNRPSIANAFGDKEELYRTTLAGFADQLKAEVSGLLSQPTNLKTALTRFYGSALDVYFSSSPAPGCFVMCTAPVEAIEHPGVREDLRQLIAELDGVLAVRFERAKGEGDFPVDADAKLAAQMTQALLHSIAIRARSGASKTSLRKMATRAIEVLLAGN